MGNNKLNKRQIVFTLLTVVFILFIFGNSLQPATTSAANSGGVVQLLQNMFASLGIPITVSELFIRKLAHFVEYTTLGILLGITVWTYTKRLLAHIFKPLFLGLAIPVADESIQLFAEGRAGMVQDVVLDFSGVLTGLTLTVLIILIRARRKTSKSE